MIQQSARKTVFLIFPGSYIYSYVSELTQIFLYLLFCGLLSESAVSAAAYLTHFARESIAAFVCST